MKIHFRKLITVFLGMAIVVGALSQSISAEAKETEWLFEYTGSEQGITVPFTGIYQFEATGAQGGNSVCTGGKGGKVTATVLLNKGDKITIAVGGQDGYNGGGTGTISNGGGATNIRVNQVTIAVAGGGGGGNAVYTGGEGGAGNTGALESGEGMSTLKGAGGGAGYRGGNAGIEHIVEHIHEGDKKSGGKCYTPVYHKHSGSASGGGCYTVPVYHKHSDTCYGEGYWCKWGEPYQAGGIADAWVSICECGAQSVSSHKTGCETGEHTYHRGELKCTKSETDTIESYSIGCGKTEKTVTGHKLTCDKVYDEYEVTQSEGGSNWLDSSICSNGISEAGVQEGNGMCLVKMLSLYNLFYDKNACRNVYYDDIKVKRVFYNDILIYKE